MTFTISDLERALQPYDETSYDAFDLTAIRRAGTRRRHLRVAGVSAGSLVAATVAAVSISSGIGVTRDAVPDRGRDVQTAAPMTDAQPQLSPLAQRVLAEVPGARQVSPTKVVVPAPDALSIHDGHVLADGPRPIEIELPAHSYAFVTAYDASAWPAWLQPGVVKAEQEQNDGDGVGDTIGAFPAGILVDQGPRWLGCPGPSSVVDACTPTFAHLEMGKTYWDWGLGFDLKPGARLQVHLESDWSTGEQTTLAAAALDAAPDGVEVARVVFVTTDGRETEGQLDVGQLAHGYALAWANFPGELQHVIAYDSDGAVIEDHQLKPCNTPAECETR